jgi:hypothetical protein
MAMRGSFSTCATVLFARPIQAQVADRPNAHRGNLNQFFALRVLRRMFGPDQGPVFLDFFEDNGVRFVPTPHGRMSLLGSAQLMGYGFKNQLDGLWHPPPPL